MKFKTGDRVELVHALEDADRTAPAPPVGTRGMVIAVDAEWGAHPYEVDFDSECFYDDEHLQLVSEPEVVTSAIRRYVVKHYVTWNKTLLQDESGTVIWTGVSDMKPNKDLYLLGFFDGLHHLGIEYEVTAEYYA